MANEEISGLIKIGCPGHVLHLILEKGRFKLAQRLAKKMAPMEVSAFRRSRFQRQYWQLMFLAFRHSLRTLDQPRRNVLAQGRFSNSCRPIHEDQARSSWLLDPLPQLVVRFLQRSMCDTASLEIRHPLGCGPLDQTDRTRGLLRHLLILLVYLQFRWVIAPDQSTGIPVRSFAHFLRRLPRRYGRRERSRPDARLFS